MSQAMDFKAFMHELKTNRKTQVAVVLMPLTLAGMIYFLAFDNPTPSKGKKTTGSITTSLGDQQTQALNKLPDLAKLDKAGEVPREDRMYRDLFTFDLPAPPPPKPVKVVPTPPPPPPTPEQIAAEKLRAARQTEQNAKPQTLRYLGYMGNSSSGRIGAFMKGEDSIPMRKGDMAGPQWRLQTLNENFAEFENLKFPDLKFRIEAGGDSRAAAPSVQNNEF